jgi:hypothetical protein
MARKLVFETKCSRCDRTETQEAPKDAPAYTDEGEVFYGILSDGLGPTVEVKFEDLCSPCKRTIRAVLEHVGKRIEGLSPDRKAEKKPRVAKKKAEEKAATQQHAGQPPVTHSATHSPAGTLKPAAAPAQVPHVAAVPNGH